MLFMGWLFCCVSGGLLIVGGVGEVCGVGVEGVVGRLWLWLGVVLLLVVLLLDRFC